MKPYREFLRNKAAVAQAFGFVLERSAGGN